MKVSEGPRLGQWRWALLALLGVATGGLWLRGGVEPEALWQLPLAGFLGTAIAGLASWGSGRFPAPGASEAGRGSETGGAAAAPGIVGAGIQLVHAALLGWLTWRALHAETLHDAAAALAALAVAELALRRPEGRLRTGLAWLIGLGAPLLLRLAGTERVARGGDLTLEWLGIPFSGDPATTLAFLALILPLALPAGLGGALGALSGRPLVASRLPVGLAASTVARTVAYGTLFARAFAGTEALLWPALGLAWIVPATAARQGAPDARLTSLAYASLWTLMAILATATERSLHAYSIGLGGWALGAWVVALAAGFARFERSVFPGTGPDGLGRLFPVTFLAAAMGAGSLVGLPWLVGMHGRIRGAGALELSGEGGAALAALLTGPALLALVALPWLREVFFDPPAGTDTPPRRRREPVLFLVLLILSSVVLFVAGVAPSWLVSALPFSGAPVTALPGPGGLLQAFAGSLLAASFFPRSVTDLRPGSGGSLSSDR